MNANSPDVIGYTTLPARFRLARKRVFDISCLLSFSLWLLWFALNESAQHDFMFSQNYAERLSYTRGFIGGFVFATAFCTSLFVVLEGFKIHYKIGQNILKD